MKFLSTKVISLLIMLSTLLVVVIIYNTRSSQQSITIQYRHNSLAIDPRNIRAIVGWSSHVFVAKVTKEEGPRQYSSDLPRMAFLGEVLDVIKGDLPKEITLIQLASIDKNVLWIEDGDDLLQLDKVYLFVTKYDKEKNAYYIVEGGNGSIPITDDSQKAALMKQYSEAYQNEIPYDPNNPGNNETILTYPAPYPIDTSMPDQVDTNRLIATPVDASNPEPTTTPMQLISSPSTPAPGP